MASPGAMRGIAATIGQCTLIWVNVTPCYVMLRFLDFLLLLSFRSLPRAQPIANEILPQSWLFADIDVINMAFNMPPSNMVRGRPARVLTGGDLSTDFILVLLRLLV